jgi:hypothetical protein
MGTERRQYERKRVLRRGKIVFRKVHGVIDCVLMNISDGGAGLKGPGIYAIPERFELRLEHGPTYAVALCHRAIDYAGVRFLDELSA